jgi:hypothetical protein
VLAFGLGFFVFESPAWLYRRPRGLFGAGLLALFAVACLAKGWWMRTRARPHE